MLTDQIPNHEATISEPTQTEILSLLDVLIDDVINKERDSDRSHKSTTTLFRCDDPSVIVVAHSYEEMIRIVEEYRGHPGNCFNRTWHGLASADAVSSKSNLFPFCFSILLPWVSNELKIRNCFLKDLHFFNVPRIHTVNFSFQVILKQ